MDQEKLRITLQIGETIAVEFKKCSNRIENDVYQSVCSFLNRFGGDIYLGVEDDGTVCGVPENAAGDMVKNFIKIISNPNMFTPTIYLSPEIIKYEGKTIIHIHIPVSAEVHSFKKEVYDSDEELLRSAGLYGKDRVTGESGYNLAAVMLLGNDCKYINS